MAKSQLNYLITFNGDHIKSLENAHFTNGYPVTEAFVRKSFGENIKISSLPLNKFTNVHEVDIMLIDANHCPGSVMLLFRLAQTATVHLHTGDFRAHTSMLELPGVLSDYVTSRAGMPRIGTIFLDTTFCAPKYSFPEQELVIAAAATISSHALQYEPDTRILCGMYTIGKERFVLGLAEHLDVQVWLPPKQRGLIQAAAHAGCGVCRALLARSIGCQSDARLHVTDMARLAPRRVSAILPSIRAKRLLAWKPSGWMYNPTKKVAAATFAKLPFPRETMESLRDFVSVEMVGPGVTVLGAAYSEHSSYDELKEFITRLRPMRVQPTVFSVPAKDARNHLDDWLRAPNPS